MLRTCAILALLPAVTLAQHTGDIALTVHEGRIETGAFVGSSATIGERVFLAAFGAEGFPDFTDSPGFDNFSGTFPTGTSVGFDLVDALRLWDGSDFDTIPANTISIEFLSLGPVFTPASAGAFQPGFALPVSSNGQWHRHLDFYLDPPAVDGVYLLTLELYSSATGIARSEPFHIVFSRNASPQDIDDAVAFLTTPAGCGPADVTTTGTSSGTPDGVVDVSDYSFFLTLWAQSDPAADVTTTGTANGTPDGAVDVSDFSFYLTLWAAGCP